MSDPGPPRRWLPSTRTLGAIAAIGSVAFVALLLVKPGQVRAVLGSPAAMIRFGALGITWLLVCLAVLRLARSSVVRVVGCAAPTVALVAVLFAGYSDRRVDEALPFDLAAVDVAASTTTTAAAPAAGSQPIPSAPPTTTTTVAPSPVALATGPFRGIDHRASGGATLYRDVDGTLLVRLDEIDIEPGPDYDVYLVEAGQERPDGGTRLDDLKGNVGSQNYPVPPDAPTPASPAVLVWCERYQVPVALADLQTSR